MPSRRLIAAGLAALLFLAAAPVQAQAPAKIPVLLDTDIGDDIDDAFALALALASPELDLRGVTTVTGDAHTRALMVCRFLAAVGRAEIPVASGSLAQKKPDRKGQMQYGLGDGFRNRPVADGAVEFLYKQLKARPGELTVLAVGPLTNVAELLKKHPDCKPWIKRLVIMGGAVRVGYNNKPPPQAEWNIKSDVKAAQAVFAAGVPLVVAPLDATTMLKLEAPPRQRLFAAKTLVTDQLQALYQLWEKKAPVLFDPVAVMLCFSDRFCTMENLRLEVDEKGITKEVKGKPNARVATAIRADEFLKWYAERLAPPARPRPGAKERQGQRNSPETAAEALKALEAPIYKHEGFPEGVHPPWVTPAEDYSRTCTAAIDLLIDTKAPVKNELLRIARSKAPLRMRYRAVHILGARGNAAVVPVLDRMCASQDPAERALAWSAYNNALQEKKLLPPPDVTRHLALYAKETDEGIRSSIVSFFGAARAKAAVKLLCKRVARNQPCVDAIEALGEIGDKSAVPLIIAAHWRTSDGGRASMAALGKLATLEAVDFLLKNLDAPFAPEALVASKSAKALPALQVHFRKLTDRGFNATATRIAIVRLSLDDPRELLMRIAEDRRESCDVRSAALQEVIQAGHVAYEPRILKLYIRGEDSGIRFACFSALEKSALQGVTLAMEKHALYLAVSQFIDGRDCLVEPYLLRALNRRLGTSFEDMTSLRAYLLSPDRDE